MIGSIFSCHLLPSGPLPLPYFVSPNFLAIQETSRIHGFQARGILDTEHRSHRRHEPCNPRKSSPLTCTAPSFLTESSKNISSPIQSQKKVSNKLFHLRNKMKFLCLQSQPLVQKLRMDTNMSSNSCCNQ